jgi:hypothetical protein
VLQRSPAAIQASLGRPIHTKAVPSGDVHLPDGGISRVYTGNGTRIDIDFEKERSTTVDRYSVRVIAAYPTLDHIDTIVLSVHPLP